MDDNRFARLENRVDEIKDDLAEVKAEQKITLHGLDDIKTSMQMQHDLVKAHVAGDDKIITEIQPVIDEFKFQQERKKRRTEKLKNIGLKLGIPATLLTMVGLVIKIIDFF